jgi:transaldolase/glucose-6-phosphate isomerase
MTSRLAQLSSLGQAVWFDFVERKFLKDGKLAALVAADGLRGVTSNPSIFEKAIGHGDAYDADLRAAFEHEDVSVIDAYEGVAIADIQAAADDLRGVYGRLDAADGYVSLEVSPYLALDTEGTLAEARRLWAAVDRPNLMVKVPGTPAGAAAIRELIADGININVTLLFAVDAYAEVAEAYLAGLEQRVAAGLPVDRIASVASFFVSRIDSKVDKAIDQRVAAGDSEADALKAIRGKVAIANAKMAYAAYQDLIAEERWQRLAAKGAMPQRLLWASTGTKDKSYPDTLYIDALIGADTVNTMPPDTMDAFRDHGTVATTLTQGQDEARHVMAEVDRLGLDFAGITTGLVTDGVQQFSDAADALLGAVAAKRTDYLGDRIAGFEASLPPALAEAVAARIEQAEREAWSRKLWAGDASLWTGGDQGKWLGWLAAAKGEQVDMAALDALRGEARRYDDAVLLGMGGSSLGPEVLGRILGSTEGNPRLHVLDTTDPGQIAAVANAIDPARTLFIVSSKSGSTMEPELLRAFFFDAAGGQGGQFVAVTDPGSKLEKTAAGDGFAHVFPGDPAIGGRYSVLSVFGMVPAAAIGIDVAALFAAALPMVRSCGPDVPPSQNPGVRLGAILGEAAKSGRDKLTIVTSETLRPPGAWLEQLLAESTGKQGKGIVPVDLEPLGSPDSYGDDRVFAELRLASEPADAKLDALAAAGHPVLRISLREPMQVAQEFVRWEIATAIAGAVIGIDPFDQPDVEDAKVKTRELVDAYEQSGSLDVPAPTYEDADLAVFGGAAGADPAAILRAHLNAVAAGGYVGFLAYIERNPAHEAAVERMRIAVRDGRRVATVAGFGPRFLHSTGQAYKGGPAGGVFVTLTREPDPDLSVPGRRATFGTVQQAQAIGDDKVLEERGRHTIRVHLKTAAALDRLEQLIAAAAADTGVN